MLSVFNKPFFGYAKSYFLMLVLLVSFNIVPHPQGKKPSLPQRTAFCLSFIFDIYTIVN